MPQNRTAPSRGMTWKLETEKTLRGRPKHRRTPGHSFICHNVFIVSEAGPDFESEIGDNTFLSLISHFGRDI